jgi:hypothetical protein
MHWYFESIHPAKTPVGLPPGQTGFTQNNIRLSFGSIDSFPGIPVSI